MKATQVISIVCMLLNAACNTVSGDRKAGTPQPTEDSKNEKRGWVLFGIPAEQEFVFTGDALSTYVREIVYRVTTKDSRCKSYQIYEIRSYKGAETISVPVDARCDYWLSVAIGRENTQSGSGSDLSFDSIYRTEESVRITLADFNESREAPTTIRLHRTDFGSQVDFGAEWINALPGDDGGSGRDDIIGGDDSLGGDDLSGGNDASGGDDSSGGSDYATYSQDLEPILKASCTVCHSLTGSRSNSDLTTYSATMRYKEFVVLKVLDGSMPTSGALPRAQQDLFQSWKDGGYKE